MPPIPERSGKESREKRSFSLVDRKRVQRETHTKGFLSGAFLPPTSLCEQRSRAVGDTLQKANAKSTAPQARPAALSIGIPRLTARRVVEGKRRSAACGGCSEAFSRKRHDFRRGCAGNRNAATRIADPYRAFAFCRLSVRIEGLRRGQRSLILHPVDPAWSAGSAGVFLRIPHILLCSPAVLQLKYEQLFPLRASWLNIALDNQAFLSPSCL